MFKSDKKCFLIALCIILVSIYAEIFPVLFPIKTVKLQINEHTYTLEKRTEHENFKSANDKYKNIKVYCTSTGKCYHKEDCSYIHDCTEITLSEALNLGLRACSKCNPPKA